MKQSVLCVGDWTRIVAIFFSNARALRKFGDYWKWNILELSWWNVNQQRRQLKKFGKWMKIHNRRYGFCYGGGGRLEIRLMRRQKAVISGNKLACYLFVADFEKLRKKETEKGQKKKEHKWEPPQPGCYKINIDAAFRTKSNTGGWVL